MNIVAAPENAAADMSDPLSIVIGIVGAVVGVIGLFLSWSSGRAERAAGRLEQLIAMNGTLVHVGHLPPTCARWSKHRAFVAQLNEEIRLHQQFAFKAARRGRLRNVHGGRRRMGAVRRIFDDGGLLRGSVDRLVSDIVAGESWVLAWEV